MGTYHLLNGTGSFTQSFRDGSLGPYTRLLQAYGGAGVVAQGDLRILTHNPHFNPIPRAWLAINSIYLKK